MLCAPLPAYSNRRPDEEGIKTGAVPGTMALRTIQTADLMKKGLRRASSTISISASDSNRRPDEEGIKTREFSLCCAWAKIQTADLMKKGLRPTTRANSRAACIQTADLMKKGLRQALAVPDPVVRIFKPQT